MITPKEKIKVFISSACGKEQWKQKYNYVREALKTLLESTGFAEAYVFESEGASTISAGQHYTIALEDCDVCIFLIDNADDIPSGVLKEIDTAKKHDIKSFFYFCDQFQNDETPLEKSLRGAQYAKSKTIHEFKDIIKNGAIDLINDLVMIYKNYCKGRLTWYEDPPTEQSVNISNIELSTSSESVAQKDVLNNIDLCNEYFTKLILDLTHDEVKATSELDQLCAAFLPVLFGGQALSEDSLSLLLAEIEKHQTPQHFTVTEKRYEAVREYFSGNQEFCVSKLDEALQIAKQNGSPEWLIKDILIDLRNQDSFLHESRNEYSLEQKYQKELDDSESLLYYPLLDRFDSGYYEGIIEEAIKYKTQSPGTITYGHGLGKHIRLLAGIYVLAICNASLTHLQLLYERIKYIAFYCASKYSNWSIKKLLLKTAIIDRKSKEIDGIVRCFGDLLSKMNEEDAQDIYFFADNRTVTHQRFISKLEAFRITGYYMSDKFFITVWNDLYGLISQWIESNESTVVVGSHIFRAIEGSYLRIPQDQIIDIICQCIQNNKRRFNNDISNLIRKCVNLNKASPTQADALLESMVNIVQNPAERNNISNLNSALFTLRKQNRKITETLDKAIAEHMPSFYGGDYLLETSFEESADMPKFLETYIAQVLSDNEKQGRNGAFFGRGNQPHITIKNILKYSKVDFSNELADSAFKVSSNTLLEEKQTIDAKIDAVELLVYLLNSQPDIQKRNEDKITKLLSNRMQLETAQSIMTNLSETNLRFSVILLYSCLGEEIVVSLLEILADISDDILSNRKASAAFLNYLEARKAPIPNIQLEHIILQQAIEWCANSDLDTRWNAAQILFSLLNNSKNENIVCAQLVKLMDTDNVYIKNSILRKVHLLENIDFETYNYIIQKATVDTNYVVRIVAVEVQEQAGLFRQMS